MRLDVRNMTQQQIADANERYLENVGAPRPMKTGVGAIGNPFMGQPLGGVPPMGVPPMGFGQSVNNFGATPGIGNPMQDAFQQFLSAQGAGGTGMPPIGQPMGVPPMGFGMGAIGMPFIGEPMGGRRPYGQSSYADPRPDTRPDPFKPLIQLRPTEQNLTPEQRASIEQERLRQNAYDNPGPTQEELARNNAQRDALMPQPMTFPSAGGFGTPPMGRDPFRRSDEGIPLWMQLGRDTGMPPVGIAGGVGTPAMGDYSMYAPEYRPGGQYGPTPPNRPMSDPFKPQISGGPVGQPMSDPFKPQISGGPVGQPMSDPFKPQISGGPVGMAGGGTGTPPIGQPTTQPPAGGLSYNDGFYNPPSAPRQPLTQPPAPVAMKKGGFAVKPVWDKKRPKDLGKPKDLSAKKEKSAKARAKAAGRPYPNLIDNMAVARKKGK